MTRYVCAASALSYPVDSFESPSIHDLDLPLGSFAMDSSLLESSSSDAQHIGAADSTGEQVDSAVKTSASMGATSGGLGQAASAIRGLLMTAAVASAAISSTRVRPAPIAGDRPIPRQALRFATAYRASLTRSLECSGKIKETNTTRVTADYGGEVVAILVEPGQRVEKDTVLVQLHDRAAERAVVEAQRGVRAAAASKERLQLDIDQQKTDLSVSITQAQLNYDEACKAAETDEALYKRGFRSEERYRNTLQRRQRTWDLFEALIQRSTTNSRANALSLQEKEVHLARAHERLADCQQHVNGLTIRATANGVLQPLTSPALTIGQNLSPGAAVANIVQESDRLEAVCDVSGEDSRHVLVDQRAHVRGPGIELSGRVTEVALSDGSGQLTIDLTQGTAGESCTTLWPGTPVTATIRLASRAEVLQVATPDGVQPNTSSNLFCVVEPGRAVRIPVKFGHEGEGSIEIIEGLSAGDEVIVSNSSPWSDRFALNFE